MLKCIPCLQLVYEEDLLTADKHQNTLDKTFVYLGLPESPVKTELRRITPVKIADFVKNYEELEEFIGKGRYADSIA